jgi:prolyl oligopeptidase
VNTKAKWIAMVGVVAFSQAAAMAQDRYQWLEAPNDPKAMEWARTQSAAAQAKIAAMPDHAAVAAELRRVLAAGNPPPQISLLGPIALRFQKSAVHPHGVLSVAQRSAGGAPGAWRDVLDIDALRKREGKPFELHFGLEATTCLAPDYVRCILALSPAGGDETELREFDLASGRFVENGFKAPASRAFVTWMDKGRLLIEHTVGDAPKLKTGWAATAMIWRRGTPLGTAKEVYRADPADALTMLGGAGSGSDRVGLVLRAIDYSTFEYRIVRPNGSVETVPLPRKLKMALPGGAAPRIVVQLAEDAVVEGRRYVAESVLSYETAPGVPADKRLSLVYAPQDGEFLSDPFSGLSASRTKVRMVLDRRGVKRLVTAERAGDGWSVNAVAAEPAGVAATLGIADPQSDDVIVQRAGYLLPTRLDLVGRAGALVNLFAEKPAFDASRFRVELKTARSKDGTEIDYFLLRPATLAKPGATPTLMTGYGAFGITISPGYLDAMVGGRALVPWLDRGGALVLPLIRGGGDRGETWHQAAMREKRQNSYDDFAAVTEALIKDGFTTPAHIGVFGSSNGGLLAAVMGTQRPDFYGAIVSDVPLTDLVRMPFMGMGAAWINEYGNPADPAALEVLNRYSPYQRVTSGVKYPPFLVTVATSDNRVGPGHARKLAAKLAEVGAPVYLLEDQEGGHGVSDPLSRPELMADRMTFLIDTLMKGQGAPR